MKKSFGIVRSSFLINEKGFIVEAWYKTSPKDTATKVPLPVATGQAMKSCPDSA
ncbi:MAG: hypothetical protein ABSD38_20305 [Syntrophorhabdales bacterium]|jgi:peroxiredoxin